jgi:hypothetical protein
LSIAQWLSKILFLFYSLNTIRLGIFGDDKLGRKSYKFDDFTDRVSYIPANNFKPKIKSRPDIDPRIIKSFKLCHDKVI